MKFSTGDDALVRIMARIEEGLKRVANSAIESPLNPGYAACIASMPSEVSAFESLTTVHSVFSMVSIHLPRYIYNVRATRLHG